MSRVHWAPRKPDIRHYKKTAGSHTGMSSLAGWAVLALCASIVVALRPEKTRGLPLGPNSPGYIQSQARRRLTGVADHYKSVGRLGSPFFGSISTYAGLSTALEACSLRREVVLVPTMGNSVDAVFQLANALG